MSDELKIDINLLNAKKPSSSSAFNNSIFIKIREKSFITNVIVSFIIYLSVFLIFYFLSKKSFYFNAENLRLIGLFLVSLILGSILSRKFEFKENDSSEKTLIKLYLSLLITLCASLVLLLLFEIQHFNRELILVVLLSGLVIETYYFMVIGINRHSRISVIEHKKLSIRYFLLDGFILTFFCYVYVFIPLFPTGFSEKEFLSIAVVFISWLISAASTHKFIPVVVSSNRWNAIELQIKFYFRIIALVIVSLIFLDVNYNVSFQFINALIGYSILSSLISMFLFAKKIQNKTDEPTVVFLKAYEMDSPVSSKTKNGNSKYSFNSPGITESAVKQKLGFEYLKDYGEVFSVLDNMLDLKSFDTRKTVIIESDEPNNVSSLQPGSQQLFVNLHILNDQIQLNDYILDVRNTLADGGVFVGALLPHHYRYQRFIKTYSFWTANMFYFFDFMWKRVFPKLPITREIYFNFAKEKDRAISLAEGLGRLVYCGFKIIDLAAVDDVVYFAVVKNGSYTPVKKFFYSPMFKMKRIGKGGKTIYVYKLRTMYPYSEFIQDFVYKHNNLESGGKFKDDFRVPAWGRLFRKLWIDELPMLINWVKRDLKFIGVRPISFHYLSLYSKEHQERRKNFKPGLLPPFYADLPKTIEEIELSEKKYLDSYEKNPVKTDFRYFFMAMNNILIKHKRSA
ncbi:MAG: sugar transferase [Ignavibacteriales bacterium]|nr:sugar transferase [Ignavibacteriales bacterium]